MIKTFKNHPYCQAKIYINDEAKEGEYKIVLQSYNTFVLYIDNNDILDCTGLYSRTTIKHIGYFLREFYPSISYYDVKNAYNKGKRLNLITKELVD